MANITSLNKEQFDKVFSSLRVNPRLDKDIVFDIYEYSMSGAETLLDANIFGRVIPINPVNLILYIVNEYGFYMDSRGLDNLRIIQDEMHKQKIASLALDKYFTNEHLSYQNRTKLSKFSPQISTLSLYYNFILGILSSYKKRDPSSTLITDFLHKAFSMSKAITELIVDGFETEAFSTWRTLHETECILILLTKYGKKTIEAYLRHLDYSMAYRGIKFSKEETDAIFEEIKEKMRSLNLKSKDMKKFIEYGWLTSIEGATSKEGFKYNFRDGVERVADLSSFSNTYEMASEIAHSSPLLIYSRNDYFLHVTLYNLLASFFRIEGIFSRIYVASISEEEKKRFLLMRNTYYPMIEYFYHNEETFFKNLGQQKR